MYLMGKKHSRKEHISHEMNGEYHLMTYENLI